MNVAHKNRTIYILRRSDGQALYVGITGDLDRRLAVHRRKPWGDAIATVELLPVDDNDRRPYIAEQAVIVQEQPLHNVEIRREQSRQEGDCYWHRFCQEQATTTRRVNYQPLKWKMVGVCEKHARRSYSRQAAA